MKATELITHLQDFIRRYGDGSVCIGALETLPHVEMIGETLEYELEELELHGPGKPVFILYPEGPPLTEYHELFAPGEGKAQ